MVESVKHQQTYKQKATGRNPLANLTCAWLGDIYTRVVGHRPSYGRGTKCVFLGFCCVDATQVMGVMGWGGGDGNVP